MKLFRKKPSFFDEKIKQIYSISDLLMNQGQYDGACRYLEIVAVVLVYISAFLREIRWAVFFGVALYLGHLIASFF